MVLRDGRRLYGLLRSYDQFGNLVLDDTIERYFVDLEHADEHIGPFLVRGENIVLVGEIVRRVGRVVVTAGRTRTSSRVSAGG